MEQQAIITVKDLRTYFYSDKRCNKVLNGVSFELYKGRTLCVVGESGCGKSVTASSIMQLLPKLSRIESGAITYHSEKGDIRIDQLPRNGKEMRALRGRDIAMIFQDPISSLNPRMTVEEIISEGLKTRGEKDKELIRKSVASILNKVGLLPEHGSRYPHEFSGGQRQRIGIARSLVVKPSIIIADEPVSALDVSIQAQVINLLMDIKKEMDLTILFIAHNLAVVKYFSDRIGVMHFGTMVELADADELYAHPVHPYTKSLLSAIPQPDPDREKDKQRIYYDPSMHDYSKEQPSFQEIRPGHFVYASDSEMEKYRKEL